MRIPLAWPLCIFFTYPYLTAVAVYPLRIRFITCACLVSILLSRYYFISFACMYNSMLRLFTLFMCGVCLCISHLCMYYHLNSMLRLFTFFLYVFLLFPSCHPPLYNIMQYSISEYIDIYTYTYKSILSVVFFPFFTEHETCMYAFAH